MNTRCFAILLLSVYVLTTAPLLQAQDVKLQVGITGTNNLEGLQDPVTVAQIPAVSKLLIAMADTPRSADYITQALSDTGVSLDALLGMGLIKSWGDSYAIGFNYLTLEDHDLLLEALPPFAESLAQTFRNQWDELEAIFRGYGVDSVTGGQIAYAVIGAMSLDWDGLDITAAKDLRTTADNLPGGLDFVIWAKEQSKEKNVKELYWGSHNTVVDGTRYTTFGDHYSLPRHALPDLLWYLNQRVANIDDVPRSLRIGVYKALEPYYTEDFLRDVGAILESIREGAGSAQSVSESADIDYERTEKVLALLLELQYLTREQDSYRLSSPYFALGDKPMIDAARQLGWQLMDEWLDRNYAAMQEELDGLTARQYGVPYQQLFTEIWHYLFGLANKELVASGHFANPYAEERVSKGMLPFVFKADLMEPLAESGD